MITKDDACPVCESRNRIKLGRPGKINEIFRRFAEADSVQVVRCSDCSALYLNPMIYFSEALQKELYNIQYFNAEGAVRDLKNIGEKKRILELTQHSSGGSLKGKTMLDIGCGTGEFLVTGSQFGMAVTGTDVDPSISQYIHDKYGFTVVTGIFGPATFPKESFDVVVLSHVIEHLQRPADLLSAIHATLKPDGLFVMSTPNADSFMEKVHNLYGRIRHDRARSYYLAPFISPYHIVGFNLKSAKRLLQRMGFSPVYCKLHSGLEWEDADRKLAMKTIKVAGAILRQGMSLVTVSRKA
jgi:2-polyprenyl-3-methyl-5-hydroxy-6-metoxy-1,4-benzoquinol methylase